MSLAAAERIVDAVLYEGYILYPYRGPAIEQRQRWAFGGLSPSAYHAVHGHRDPYRLQAQCLVQGDTNMRLGVRIRFLQPVARQIGELPEPLAQLPADGAPEHRPVEAMTVDGVEHASWQEAFEREIHIPAGSLATLLKQGRQETFQFPARREIEALRRSDGQVVGLITRDRMPIYGEVSVRAERVAEGAYRLTATVANHSPLSEPESAGRERAQLQSMASSHLILSATGGAFASLMDPPASLAEAAAACASEVVWPVLVGDPEARDTVLCSPIVLLDYPEVAPERPCDLCDGTEIDELLSLRIMSMNDDERRELAATDARARALIERTEALGRGDMERGAFRARPAETLDAQWPRGTAPAPALEIGQRVRLHPKLRDRESLDGKVAVVTAIERDRENRVQVAVVIDGDPGGGRRGRRFFFSLEEVEAFQSEGEGAE